MSIPSPSKNDIAKFTQLYDRSKSPNSDVITGEQARSIFLKANLPNDTLGSIWGLVDVNLAGSLNQSQFVLAMHLIQLVMSKNQSVSPLPQAIPQYLWDSLNDLGSSRVTSPGASTEFLNSGSTSEWAVPAAKKQDFDKIFDSLDAEKTGHLSSATLVPFFLSSKLSQDVLASVWDLADINNSSEFTKTEFAIAMYLIQKKNSGIELPETLPQTLLTSVTQVAKPGQPVQAPITNKSVAPAAPAAVAPSVSPVASSATAAIPQVATSSAAAAIAAPIAAVTTAAAVGSAAAPADKEKKINNELTRIQATKKRIESQLDQLHSTHDKNVKETEQLELNLIQRQNELKALQKHLAQLEGSNSAELSNINELNDKLKAEISKKNEHTNRIATLTASSDNLSKDLAEKQTQFKQQSSLLDVNKKQLETGEIRNSSLQAELGLLSASLPIFVSKFKSLLENQAIVEQQHAKLQEKYKGLDKRNNDLKSYEVEIENQTKEIESNEQKCDEKIDNLQRLFDDFTLKQKSYEEENEKLKSNHLNYAQDLQDLTERQMKLNLGEVPDNIDDILIKLNLYNKAASPETVEENTELKESEPQNATTASTEGEARTVSDVFDRDLPVVGSQTEAEPEDERDHENAAEILDDRFEGDLNEYGIPRTQSLTSSVANNAPLSVRDPGELPETSRTSTTEAELVKSENTEELDLTDNINELQEHSAEPTKVYADIDEEFPPIQEPEIEESDSSDDEEIVEKPQELSETKVEDKKLTEASELQDDFNDLSIDTEEKPNEAESEESISISEADLQPTSKDAEGLSKESTSVTVPHTTEKLPPLRNH